MSTSGDHDFLGPFSSSGGTTFGITTSESVDSLVGIADEARSRTKRSKKPPKAKAPQTRGAQSGFHPMRQLPCRTFLSCGTCSFNNRCLFLHPTQLASGDDWLEKDLRIAKYGSFAKKLTKANGEQTDALYFPTMSMDIVSRQLDERGQPLISQDYVLPVPSPQGNKKKGKGKVVDRDVTVAPVPQSLSNEAAFLTSFSVWHHLLDLLQGDQSDDSCDEFNAHTGKKRLRVFRILSEGNNLAT